MCLKRPSFVCEVLLRVSPAQEETLPSSLEAARHLYNACLAEAVKRVRLLQQSRLWEKAQGAVEREPRSALIREACSGYGFADAAFQHYAAEVRRSSWIGDGPEAGYQSFSRRPESIFRAGPEGTVQRKESDGHR